MNVNDVTPHELDEEAPGGLVINPHSALGKELRKWEQHITDLTPRGTRPGNPYVYRPYPRMLYKAQRLPNMQMACMMPAPHPYDFQRPEDYERAVNFKESFDRTCCKIVANEEEERIAKGQGWAKDPVAAKELHEQHEQAIGNAAAEAAYAAQRMTDTAKRELKAADDLTHEHVVDVVGPKRGRAPKAIAGSGEVEA